MAQMEAFSKKAKASSKPKPKEIAPDDWEELDKALCGLD
jgi:hypothetical protein